MEIDAINKAGLVRRAVESVEHDGRPAKLITAARTYPTSVDDLWDAVTNIERIPRWFLPITGDLRPGGRYELEGNASGEVLSCDPPHRFQVTWEFGGDVSWVTVELTGDPDTEEAHLELQHLAHVPDEPWDLGPGAVGVGWDLGLMGLDLHVSSGEAADPAAVLAWETTPEAASFIARAATGWGEAAMANGTDSEEARAEAQRVTAFYTGAEE